MRSRPDEKDTDMADLRIFSYLPNPRVFKATIAARISGASVEVVGGKPPELLGWLWDYDAHELSEEEKTRFEDIARIGKVGFAGAKIYKTDAFLKAHPFGDVPAAFGAGGDVGLFESNSIMRAAARLGANGAGLYGDGDPLKASRIDGFLDRTLVFALEAQRYLLSFPNTLDKAVYADMEKAFASYALGIEQALSTGDYLCGDALTLADIAFVCELCLLSNDASLRKGETDAFPAMVSKIRDYPRMEAHLFTLMDRPEFSEDLSGYRRKMD